MHPFYVAEPDRSLARHHETRHHREVRGDAVTGGGEDPVEGGRGCFRVRTGCGDRADGVPDRELRLVLLEPDHDRVELLEPVVGEADSHQEGAVRGRRQLLAGRDLVGEQHARMAFGLAGVAVEQGDRGSEGEQAPVPAALSQLCGDRFDVSHRLARIGETPVDGVGEVESMRGVLEVDAVDLVEIRWSSREISRRDGMSSVWLSGV